MRLIKEMETLTEQFRPAFRRQATFAWFVIVLWSLMLRLDMAGVTSIVRCMGLHPGEYVNLLHFFHSSAFCVSSLCSCWQGIVLQRAQPICLNAMPLYVVDGIKVGKAGKKMPGVKLLYQESDDNTKPEYIMGHYWGAIGLLVHASQHVISIPLRFQIQDGLKRSPSEAASLVDKMGTLVTQTIHNTAEGGLVIGDIYYSTRGFMGALREADLHYLGKVKSSTVAYHLPEPTTCPRPRGRPRKYGAKVKLAQLFDQPELFQQASVQLYGELENVRYHSIDLLWQGFYVRFVLSIRADGKRAIFLSTDRTLRPQDIIYAYGLRQKIEVSFKALVHTLCGFGYHFWMMAMPKLKRGDGNQYLHRAGDHYRAQVLRKIEAYERFVNISAIALGVLQLLAIRMPSVIWSRFPVWMRTLPKHGCPSENVVRLTLQHELHQSFLESNDSTLLEKILATKKTAPYPPHPIKIAA